MPDGTFSGFANGEAAERSEVVFLCVPFRNQSETLTNLKEHLREGQLVVDATVPLAAAVSGRATRMIGVWQGSAAQQAAEMVPAGVRVVSALHTVSAAVLRDPAQTPDEDVLVCGDKKADKARAVEIIERVPGLRCVDCGRLEQSRIAESLTALLIGVNSRYKTHAGIRITGPPGDAVAAPVVVLAGGTGGAKLARGLLDEAGDDLVVVANTGDDIEIHGGYVSPDPDLVTFWLADRIDERGWGLRGDTFEVMDGLRELGEESWFNLGDRDLALCVRRARRLAEGARLTEAIDEARRAYGVAARVLPASDDPVRTRVRAGGRWWPFQEFMIRHRAQGPVEGVEFRGRRRRDGHARGARRAGVRARDRDRAVEPRDLDRADARRARAARGAGRLARAGRGGLAAGRRRGAQGPDRGVHGVRRRAADAPTASRGSTRA